MRASRDTGLGIAEGYRNKTGIPKNPDAEQSAMMELVGELDEAQFQRLQKALKYCVELSLFKLIDSMEHGVGAYEFILSMRDGHSSSALIGEEDRELASEFWNWMS